MGWMRLCAALWVAAAVGGCAASGEMAGLEPGASPMTGDGYRPVESAADFLSALKGRRVFSNETSFRFAVDGGIAGVVRCKPADGVWRWDADALCLALSTEAGPHPELCVRVERAGTLLRFIDDRGDGAPVQYYLH